MARLHTQTLRQRPTPTIVVIGGPDALVHATHRVAPSVASSRVVAAQIGNAATAVAESRPFAILVGADVFELDAAEFAALARDVGAELIRVQTEGLSPIEICDAITGPLEAALGARMGG